MQLRKLRIIFTALFFSFFFVFFFSLSLSRYYSYQIFYYDFGVFSRILWELSRFQTPYIDHVVLGRIFFLGDHFNPSLTLVAPFYWLVSNPQILLFEQALALVLTGILIFLIAGKVKLGYIPSLVISLSYLIFAGTENPLVTDWHAEPTAVFFLALFFYLFSFTQKRVLYYLTAIIFLGFKESNAITFIFVLTCLLVFNKEKRKDIFMLIAASLAWLYVSTNIFSFIFSKRPYLYYPELPTSPWEMITNFFSTPEKRKLVFDSLISFGFLPFFSVFGVIAVFGELAIRLAPTKTIFQNFTLGSHYSVYLSLILTLTTIYAITNIKKIYPKKWLVSLIIFYLLIISLFSARKITKSPINLAFNHVFWKELKTNGQNFNWVDKIPKKGTVMSLNNLLPYFSARTEKLSFLNKYYKEVEPDIIIFNMTPGQSANNFWSMEEKDLGLIRDFLLQDKDYVRTKTDDKLLFIFIKKFFRSS
ncbi:MAG: DUF2079 domain-containing protein [Candidatus Roizmanbacteria bacterium]|nr:MAG: DUF2079 domain-containing protein [Candidatus Roizmanbacteria bacterium]